MLLLSIFFSSIISTSVTVQPNAMTYHGIASDADLSNIRRHGNALDSEGRLTYHQGVGITVRSDYFQTSANYFRNSTNQNSGSLMLGPKMDFWKKRFTLGLVGGAYARDPAGNTKMPGSYRSKTIEVVPMVMVSASAAIQIYKSLFFEVIAASNYILNFFTPGFRVDF